MENVEESDMMDIRIMWKWASAESNSKSHGSCYLSEM